MDTAIRALLEVAEETLTFEYEIGNVTKVGPHTTGLRNLPSLVACHVTYGTRITSPGMEPVRSKPGDAICLPPGRPYDIAMTSPNIAISRWSHTSYRILGSVDVFSLLDPPLVVRGKAATRIGDINEELSDISKQAELDLHDVIRRKALGLELLLLVTAGAKLFPHSMRLLQGAHNLAPVLSHVRSNLSGDLSRDTLARMASLSPSRFHTVFERALGKAPGRYVQDLRLQRAQQLLISRDLGVEEIGNLVGFTDAFHFSRLFKKHCGMSPSRYRTHARTAMT